MRKLFMDLGDFVRLACCRLLVYVGVKEMSIRFCHTLDNFKTELCPSYMTS